MEEVIFSKKYLYRLCVLFASIDHDQIAKAIRAIIKARDNNKNIYVVGNGGSASTASHMANDLAYGTRTKKPFKVISLSDNNALITALGNDEGYSYVFSKQLEFYANEGDLVIAISASGNSPNIIKAIDYAKQKKCDIIGFSGFDGGALKEKCDISIHVPTEKGKYGPVEDIHMIINHLIASYLKNIK